MKHGNEAHHRRFICKLDAYKTAIQAGDMERAEVIGNELQSKYVLLAESRDKDHEAVLDAITTIESIFENVPLKSGLYNHSLICNGDRHYPPGTEGKSCSCKIQPRGTSDIRLGCHLSHCNFGEYPNQCKYGDADCPALIEDWARFGRAMQNEEDARAIIDEVKELLAFIRNKYPADWHGDRYLYTCVHHQRLADLLFERSKRAKIK